MGNRALQLVTLLVAVVVGVGAAIGVRAVRNASNEQSTSSNASASSAPSTSSVTNPTPSPTASPSASPSPSSSPVELPSQAPAPPAVPVRPAGAAGYPPQLLAGSSYFYSGSGTLALLAVDNQDSGFTICAGINNTNQSIPAGYRAAYFVSVSFSDGNILSAGYIREGSTSTDFGQIQNGNGAPVGNRSSSPTAPGVHNYCVGRTSAGWAMTVDGTTVFSTAAEPAGSSSGASLHFESTIQQQPGGSGGSGQFVVPGFQNINIDGRAPTQLQGVTSTF
jgi:hypothetical protein